MDCKGWSHFVLEVFSIFRLFLEALNLYTILKLYHKLLTISYLESEQKDWGVWGFPRELMLTWDPMDELSNGKEYFKTRKRLDEIFVAKREGTRSWSTRDLHAPGKDLPHRSNQRLVGAMRFPVQLKIFTVISPLVPLSTKGYRRCKELPLLFSGWWLFSLYQSEIIAGKPKLSQAPGHVWRMGFSCKLNQSKWAGLVGKYHALRFPCVEPSFCAIWEAFFSSGNSSPKVTKGAWVASPWGGQLPGKPAKLHFGVLRGSQGTGWGEGLREWRAWLLHVPANSLVCLYHQSSLHN